MSGQCTCLPYQDGGPCPACEDAAKIAALEAQVADLQAQLAQTGICDAWNGRGGAECGKCYECIGATRLHAANRAEGKLREITVILRRFAWQFVRLPNYEGHVCIGCGMRTKSIPKHKERCPLAPYLEDQVSTPTIRCSDCGRTVRLTRKGYPAPHLNGARQCIGCGRDADTHAQLATAHPPPPPPQGRKP